MSRMQYIQVVGYLVQTWSTNPPAPLILYAEEAYLSGTR
jgi:hypothetical protein